MLLPITIENQSLDLRHSFARGENKLRQLMEGETSGFESGSMIIPTADEHRFVYRLQRGWAGRKRSFPDGRTLYTHIYLPGDVIAMKNALLPQYPDVVEAWSNVIAERSSCDVMRAAFDEDKDFAFRCMAQMVEDERQTHNWSVALGRATVFERLAYMLLQFRFRLARFGEIERGTMSFQVPMSQQQIADFSGISLVHLNKNLMKLRQTKLIGYEVGNSRS